MWPLLLIFPLQSGAWGQTSETPIPPYFPLAEYIKPVNNYGVQAALSTTVCCEPGACLIQDNSGAYLFRLQWAPLNQWFLSVVFVCFFKQLREIQLCSAQSHHLEMQICRNWYQNILDTYRMDNECLKKLKQYNILNELKISFQGSTVFITDHQYI